MAHAQVGEEKGTGTGQARLLLTLAYRRAAREKFFDNSTCRLGQI